MDAELRDVVRLDHLLLQLTATLNLRSAHLGPASGLLLLDLLDRALLPLGTRIRMLSRHHHRLLLQFLHRLTDLCDLILGGFDPLHRISLHVLDLLDQLGLQLLDVDLFLPSQ